MSQLKDEINEKIPKRTQKILIYVISVLILFIAGFFVFRPLYTKAMENMKQVEKLETTYAEYKKLDAAKELNKKNIEQYENNVKTMLSKYPKDLYPEDMIMVLSGLEQQTGTVFTDISVENNNYVTENNDKTSPSTANKSSSSSSNSTKSSSSSTSSNTSANASKNSTNSSNSSANASKNSTNSSNTSANSSKNSTNSSSNSSNSTATSKAGNAVVSSEKYNLYASPVTCAFNASYVGVKQLFTALLSNPLKKSVESVDLSYDEQTGNLMGTMVIDFYTLQYNENNVNGHEVMPDISRGTSNVFHSVR